VENSGPSIRAVSLHFGSSECTKVKIREALSQAISHGAMHNSTERDPPPRCHPGTREKSVAQVRQRGPSLTVHRAKFDSAGRVRQRGPSSTIASTNTWLESEMVSNYCHVIISPLIVCRYQAHFSIGVQGGCVGFIGCVYLFHYSLHVCTV
jgi:hypothetical protein